MFQLILPFQLELPFDAPDAARGAGRVRRARVRRAKGGTLGELGQTSAMATADLCARADCGVSSAE